MPGGGREAGGGPGFGMMMAQLDRFTIEQTDSTVFFRFAPKEGVVVPTNGRKTSTRFWPGSSEAEVKAKWTEEGLVVERELKADEPVEEAGGEGGEGGEAPRRARAGGGTVKEIYTRAPQSNLLTVITEVGGRRLRRIYELVPPAASQAPQSR